MHVKPISADVSLYQQAATRPTSLSRLQLLKMLLETRAFKTNSGARESGILKSEDGERALVRRENSANSKGKSNIDLLSSEERKRSGCRLVYYWKSWASC